MTYGKEGQVSGSSRSKMYTDRWMDLWNNIHGFNNLRSRTGQLLIDISFQRLKRLRKCQAKQPCLDTEGATESDRCSSSLRMDDIHVGPGDQSSNDSYSDSNSRPRQWRGLLLSLINWS